MSIGDVDPLEVAHLDRLAVLLNRYQPQAFSEHLAWSSHGGAFYNDLLPLPYDRASLARVCDHIDQTQERLQRRRLLENPATYLNLAVGEIHLAGFARDQDTAGAHLLIDTHGASVDAH